ncbi:melanoma inhibitory activity protein 2 isoform X1 [Clarias gariepinus]|uniref:melanoma inhibitory activity protein 2 isoform X1 n=1 Tax=Clarias gariepinus TaxID=13013 RepID=UPI00234C6727|nr:melanoma inhibitory activity protein 2 isoform X1 [Clarias gariepinus]
MEQLEEKEEEQHKILDWIGEGQNNPFESNSRDKTENKEDLPDEQSSSLLGSGLKNVFGFGEEDSPPSETKKQSQDENMQDLSEQQKAMNLKGKDSAETIAENEKTRDAGWYNSVYHRITNFYGDPSDDKSEGSSSDPGMNVDKVTDKNPEARSESILIQETNTANQDKKQELRHQDDADEIDEGWYGSVYNKITGLYGDASVTESTGVDSQVRSEPEDAQSSRDEKLEKNTELKVNENNDPGWYERVYSRINNVYGDSSDINNAPDVVKDVESQAQNENTEDTSSSSIFSINGLASVIDGLRSPFHDEPKSSLTQSHDSNDQSDDMMSKTPNQGKEEKSANDDVRDKNDELSVKSLDVISKISAQRHALGEEDEEEKEVEEKEDVEEEEEMGQDVNVAEAQINTTESSIDCNKQDMGGDREDASKDISTHSNNILADVDELSDQSDSGSARLPTGQRKNMMSVLKADETEPLTEEPCGTEFAEHVVKSSKSHESDANADNVNKSVPEKGTGEEGQKSESKTGLDSGLQVRTDVIKDSSETVEESDKVLDEREAADVLTQTEEGGMKVRSNEPNIHDVDITQGEYGGDKKSLNITLMGYDKEREGEDSIEMESPVKKDSVDISQMESSGEKEYENATQMESDGEKESLNFTQMESSRENKGEVTQVEFSVGQEDVGVAQTISDRERKSIDYTQVENSEEKDGVDTSQVESALEKKGGDTPVEYSGGQRDVDVGETESDRENKSIDYTQEENSEEKDGVDTSQVESALGKEGGVTPVEYSGGQRDVDVGETESDRENKSIDYTRVKNSEGKDGVDNSQMESALGKEGGVTQMEYSGGQEGVDVAQVETDGKKESADITQMEYSEEKVGGTTQVGPDEEKEGIKFNQKESGGEKSKDLIQKELLSLSTTHGFENTHSIEETKQNLEIDPEDSREPEKRESAAVKQAEITPKNVQDKSPPTDRSKTEIFSTSDGDPNDYVHNRNKDMTVDVKNRKAHMSAQTLKRSYRNLEIYLSEKDIEELLKLFSGETLAGLDVIIGHSEYINNEELAELHHFKKALEHLLNDRNQEIKSSLQTVQAVLAKLSKKFMPAIADGNVDKSSDPSQTECVSKTCVSTTESTPISEQDTGKEINMDDNMDGSSSRNESDSVISGSVFNDRQVVTEKSPILDVWSPQPDTNIITEEFLEPEESQNGVLYAYTVLAAEFTSEALTYMVKASAHVKQVICEVVMSLPDDMRPGPDLYGLPWEAVIITAALGLFTFLLFTCRFIHAIKSRLYCSKERRMGQKVAELLEEKCKVLETLSECEHKFKKLETALQNGGVSAQESERADLEAMSKKLEEANAQMKSDMEKMQQELDMQDQLRKQQEEQLTKLEEMLKKLEEEATERKSQLEQDKMTLKIHEMNTERLQKKLQEAKEENSMLLESKTQLEQEAEGWKERLSELEEEKRMNETSHNRMMENCVNKDEHIKSLTECLLNMRDWDSEEESAVNDTSGSENKNSSDCRQKQKVQKLINAAKMSADLKAMEEDKARVFAKLTDEIKAKEDLQESLKQLQRERESVEAESTMYSSEIEKLQHKLQIMSEVYQEKELKLHRMLTVEEKERSQKEEQLNKAGKKISLATDELNSYRQRAKDLEEEMEKSNQAYRNQIAAHEKKAHDNWLAARAADRDLADVKRENSVLRQRLTDSQFKLELMEKNPQARAPLIRGERSPYGPSPLGRPPSETRPFLSPPTLMDGPPRVSPPFQMMPGGRAPPGGVEGDRSVSYSESGSPTWERERDRERRSLGPPGPDPGLVYRRPLSAPFLRAPLPPDAYYNEKSDISFGAEGAGFRENGMRDSGRSMPGADIRGGPLPPPPFPPLDPRDPHFPRRAYRPDFFPPPPLAMRGVFPRIPLPPHIPFPPMRPPSDHLLSEPPSRPSPPGSEQPPEQPPSAHDII